MFKFRIMKKSLKGFISVMLVLSIVASIPVQFLILAAPADALFAAVGNDPDEQLVAAGDEGEAPATGDDIYTTKIIVCPTLFLRSTNKVFDYEYGFSSTRHKRRGKAVII